MRAYWKRSSLALVTLTSILSGVISPALAASPVVYRDGTRAPVGVVAMNEDGSLSVPERAAAVGTYTMDITAYTSAVDECDDDPFVTADGSLVRSGIVATNVLPFNTKVRIPELFGDRVFEVHDRMNSRYSYRMDVWMEGKTNARTFGLKRNMKVEIVEMGNGKTQWAERARLARVAKAAAKTNDALTKLAK